MNTRRPRFTCETSWRRACVATLVMFGTVPACAPEHVENDGVVETAHLRITSSEDNPICAGTPLFLESELERIAQALELPLWSENDKLDTRFGVDSVAEVCAPIFEGADEAQGCVRRIDGDLVLAAVEVANTAPHELVHAVRRHSLPQGPHFFEEGLAEVVSGSDGFPVNLRYPHEDSVYGPVELLELPLAELVYHYASAASFVSWLWETYDQPTLMSFMNDPAFSDDDAALPLFESHFGLPLAEAEQAWRSDPRPDPTWGSPCIPEHTYSLADGPIEMTGDFDCREPTVYGASHFMKLWPMCLDVPETTRVRLSLDADHGRFQVLGREPCDAGSAGAEAYRDKYLEAGDVLEEDIAGCRYRMLLFSQEPGFPATPYTIRIEEIDR